MEAAGLHYDSALNFIDSSKDYLTYSRIKRNRGIVYQRQGEFTKAKEVFETLFQEAQDQKNELGQALMYNQLGIIAQSQGNYNEAADDFNRAIEIYSKKDSANVANTLMNLGTLYGRMNLIDQSNQKLLIAAKIAGSYKQWVIQARCFNNISVNYRKVSKLDSSNYYLSLNEQLYKRLNNKLALTEVYQNKASNFLIAKNADSTYYFLENALSLVTPNQDLYRESQLAFLRARVELEFGDAKLAIQYVNEAITKALEQNRVDDLNDHYVLLSEAYEKEGNTKAALAIMKKWKSLNDSLEIFKSIKTIQEITSAYDFARSEEVIQQSREQASFFQRLSTRLAIGAVILAALSVLLYFKFRKKSNEAELRESEVNELKSKISELQQKVKKSTENFITLKSKAVIPLNKLMFVQSDGPYLEFFLDNKERPEIDRGTLKDLKSDLPINTFIQVHRSYIINIHFIREVYSNRVVLQNGHELNISRSFKTNMEEIFQTKVS
ncbi:tetratricopeptide repeat protein [Roseivirga ehrenbergii]